MISRSFSFDPPPAVGTIQMCGVLVLASRFTSTTLKITHLPSGETSGSPTRLTFIMSPKVKGCLAWGNAGHIGATTARDIRNRRRIVNILDERKSVAGFVASASLRLLSGQALAGYCL